MEPSIQYAIAVVLVAVGLAGTVLPVIPGALLIFAGLFLAAWADGFAHVGTTALVIIGVLGALSFVADFAGTLLGAKRVGASPQALVGATIGGVLGIFLGLPGLIAGPFVGAVLGELVARKRFAQAGLSGLGTWLGLAAAAVAKVALAFMMIATFAGFWWFGG